MTQVLNRPAVVGRRSADRGRVGPRRVTKVIKPYLYVAPALLVFVAGLGYPLVQSAWISLWNWNGLTTATWAGVHNYVTIFTDDRLLASFGHSLVLIIFYSVLPIIVALVLVAIMGRSHQMRGMGLFRTALFVPQVIATAVIATTWVAVYAPDGLVNQILRGVGLGALQRPWLGDFGTALGAIGLVGTWANIGLCLVLLLSGRANIPQELYESVRLDGANGAREFFAITLPQLRGQLAVAATLTSVSALKTFDLVYITTVGGPGDSTTVPAFEVFNRAFRTNQVGLGSAIGIVLTVLVLLLTLAISRIQPKE